MDVLYHWVGFVTVWTNTGLLLLLVAVGVRDRLRQAAGRR